MRNNVANYVIAHTHTHTHTHTRTHKHTHTHTPHTHTYITNFYANLQDFASTASDLAAEYNTVEHNNKIN